MVKTMGGSHCKRPIVHRCLVAEKQRKRDFRNLAKLEVYMYLTK